MVNHTKVENDSITILLFLLYFWSNKCSFGAHKRLISKTFEKSYQPQTFERKCIDILIIKISALSIMSIHHWTARPLFCLSAYSKHISHCSKYKTLVTFWKAHTIILSCSLWYSAVSVCPSFSLSSPEHWTRERFSVAWQKMQRTARRIALWFQTISVT